jgi:L-seryl-tRNA(Ser) seleniumtransferase/D-glucosaminate-6-phosphate ammonia-lyase
VTEIQLPRIINAAGQMSALGGSNSPPELAEAITRAIREAMTRPVEIARLKDEASKAIAEATGAEAGAVTTGAAAGIALSVAACVAGTSAEAIGALPFWIPRRVVLQAGHDINFGASVTQMIGLGGGAPAIAGSRETGVTAFDIAEALAEAAALVYVQSHHVRAPNAQPLAQCIELAHDQAVPVIVDAAAEEDLRAYVAMGADLVCYSGGKALGGLSSSGFVAGRAGLVQAVRAQERGIGRPMKVAQEQILSVILALRAYGAGRDSSSPAVLEALAIACAAVPGLDSRVVADEVRASIRRVEVRSPQAAAIARSLREGDPPIFVRAHQVAEGRFSLDVRNVGMGDVEVIVEALRRALDAAPGGA